MFNLFFALYMAMLRGNWYQYTAGNIIDMLKGSVNDLGTFLTSIFGDNQMTTLGEALFGMNYTGVPNWQALVCFILALITSIGIVVMAVKGIKRVFSIFFMPIR